MNKVIGMDLGDKQNVAVVFDEVGKELETARIPNTAAAVEKFINQYPNAAVAMEAGTHSAWISRLLQSKGHEVCVGNPRKLRVIWDSDDKTDERDARILGLVYRVEPRLLHGIEHRGEQAQADLEYIKARDQLVRARTGLINHTRGVVKGTGHRISACDARSFVRRAREEIPAILEEPLRPIMETIEVLSQQIHDLDKKIQYLCEDQYPETKYLLQVPGVGPITALGYVLTLESPERFETSRVVGAYLGLVPRKDQSGETDRQLPITKAGNVYLRRLLVGAAHYILGPFGGDCDLRRYGQRIAGKGGKRAKKCAAVAVARKLAVVLHRLWADQAEYRPLMAKGKAA